MRTLTIDRIDGKYVFCEDEEKKYYAIEIDEAPAGVKPGNILEIDDDGNISVKNQ